MTSTCLDYFFFALYVKLCTVREICSVYMTSVINTWSVFYVVCIYLMPRAISHIVGLNCAVLVMLYTE